MTSKQRKTRTWSPKESAERIDRTVRRKIKKEFPRVSLSSIVRYNYEHWEEIEKIIDAGVESITDPSTTSLEPPSRILPPDDYLALGLFKNKIRLIRLASDGQYSFVDAESETHRILYPSVFPDLTLAWAIEEFEELLNSKSAGEIDFQKFFERNPAFILGDEYKYAYPHIALTSGDGSRLVPDFILQPVSQLLFCDLLELKLPSTSLFTFKKNRHRYSAAVEEASAQLRTYAEFFNDRENLTRFSFRYPHLNMYKPKMFVIIGRNTPEMLREKQAVRRNLPELNLRTYDELLERMRWRRDLLKRGGPMLGF